MKRLLPYIHIMRVDHWFKNVFCVPGVVLAYILTHHSPEWAHLPSVLLGFLAVCLVASANYTINEILDAPWDREHPDKHIRPVAAGLVSVPLAYLQYALLTVASLALAWSINIPFFGAAAFLWIMGVVYNVPPLRTKEVCYLDSLTEAINNPLRLCLGWWMVDPATMPPLSIVAGYWMLGAFLMALKRCAEYRHIGDHDRAVRYRRSFAHTDDLRLLVSAVIYSNAAFLLCGVFIAKFRVEMILAIPFLALFGAYYLRISFRKNSVVQYPEKLYREKKLMVMLALAAASSFVLLVVDIPALREAFQMREPAPPALMRDVFGAFGPGD